MKKYLFLVILALSAFAIHAEYSRLVFQTLNGETKSVGLTNLNITFTNDEMIASSDGESVKIALTSLKSMEFSNDQAGIESVTVDGNLEGKITVYTTTGQRLGDYSSVTSARTALPSGIYIFKAENGHTSKMLINR